LTRFVAFLRGVNLGKRKVLSSDLAASIRSLGFSSVKTLLASGNVIFETEPSDDLGPRIEAQLQKTFAFPIPIVLRTDAELRAMIAANPFAAWPSDADVKLYVTLLARALPQDMVFDSVPGDFTVVRHDPTELYLVAHRLENGRYGESMDGMSRKLDKAVLATTRNWNTILKAVA
jgi:uncharacterized protein (DUF1697 family)